MTIIKQSCKFQMNIDLFGSHHNNKYERYCAWKPDPFAFRINCYNLNWSKYVAFAFPPFSQILRVLQKIEEDRVQKLGLVVPWWPQSTWFPRLIQHMADVPIFLPKETSHKLHIPWDGTLRHPLRKKMKLIFVHLSASCFIRKSFQQRLQTILQNTLGVNQQSSSTTGTQTSGWLSVRKRKRE